MEETYENNYANKFRNIGMVNDFTDKEWNNLSVDDQYVVNVQTKTYKCNYIYNAAKIKCSLAFF